MGVKADRSFDLKYRYSLATQRENERFANYMRTHGQYRRIVASHLNQEWEEDRARRLEMDVAETDLRHRRLRINLQDDDNLEVNRESPP